MTKFQSLRAFASEHPVITGAVGFIFYFVVYETLMGYLISHHSTGCELQEYMTRFGYRASLACEFDVFPGIDSLLRTLVFGGPFYGPLVVAVVVGMPLLYVFIGYRKLRGLDNEQAETPKVLPYGNEEAHFELLRSQGVSEEQIEALKRNNE